MNELALSKHVTTNTPPSESVIFLKPICIRNPKKHTSLEMNEASRVSGNVVRDYGRHRRSDAPFSFDVVLRLDLLNAVCDRELNRRITAAR